MSDNTRALFKWSAKYTLDELEKKYGNKLPQIVTVTDGYSSSNSSYTIASDEIYFIKSIVKQPRLVVEDEQERLLSIPLDYSLKFNLVTKKKTGDLSFGPARKLREILQHNSLDRVKKIRVDMNKSVSVLFGAEDTKSGPLGVLTVQDVYHERYYLAHSLFNNAQMHPYQVEFPVYIPIEVQVALGLTLGDDHQMAAVMSRAMEMVTLDPESEEAYDICFNTEIMFFEERDDEGYEYVNPGGIEGWSDGLEEEIETVERVYGACKTSDTRRRIQEQENWRRNHDTEPELLDIGVPVPRPPESPPVERKHVNLTDPDVQKVLGRAESPPPLIPGRVPSVKRRKPPPPPMAAHKDALKTKLEPLRDEEELEESPRLERRPSIEHDISPSHSCVSLLNLPLVDDADDHPAPEGAAQSRVGHVVLGTQDKGQHDPSASPTLSGNTPPVQGSGSLQSNVPPKSPMGSRSKVPPQSPVGERAKVTPHGPGSPRPNVAPLSPLGPRSNEAPQSPLGPRANIPPHGPLSPRVNLPPQSLTRKETMKGPKTAPKPNKGSEPKLPAVSTAQAMIQNTKVSTDTPKRADIPKETVQNKGRSQSDSSEKQSGGSDKLSGGSDKQSGGSDKQSGGSDKQSGGPLSRPSVRRGQRPYSVAGGPASHYDLTLHHRDPENPYELGTEPLVLNKDEKKCPDSGTEDENDYDYVSVPRNCGDGGNEAVTSTTESSTQKRAPKSSDIFQWADVPDDVTTLTVGDVNACLRLLNISKEVEDIDGTFLKGLREEDLREFFQVSGLEAKKLCRFIGGWRPKF